MQDCRGKRFPTHLCTKSSLLAVAFGRFLQAYPFLCAHIKTICPQNVMSQEEVLNQGGWNGWVSVVATNPERGLGIHVALV